MASRQNNAPAEGFVYVRCTVCNGTGKDPWFWTVSKCVACSGRGKVLNRSAYTSSGRQATPPLWRAVASMPFLIVGHALARAGSPQSISGKEFGGNLVAGSCSRVKLWAGGEGIPCLIEGERCCRNTVSCKRPSVKLSRRVCARWVSTMN